MPDENIYTGGKKSIFCIFSEHCFSHFQCSHTKQKGEGKKSVYVYCVHSHTYTMISGKHLHTHLFFGKSTT